MINTKITDGKGRGYKAHVHQRNGDKGLIVFTEELKEKEILFAPTVNEDAGFEMAIDGSFGGTPVIIHDGLDTTKWTGTEISGTKVTFDDTGTGRGGGDSVKVNKPTVGNIWQFDKGSDLIVANYIAFSLFINVSSGWTVGNDIFLYGWDTGTNSQVGDAVNLGDFFNEQDFGSYQKLSIPFTSMNLTTDIDAIRMECTAKSGGGIFCFMDDIQVEETSGATTFSIFAPTGLKYNTQEISFTFIDALDTTLASNSMPSLSYDKILGLTKLANGIVFNRIKDGVTTFSANITCIADSTRGGSEIINVFADATNAHITLRTVFGSPVILDSRNNDSINVIINDNLTGLISFTAIIKGFTTEITKE